MFILPEFFNLRDPNMKLLGLDIGDQWTGIAISDDLHIIASPLQTVATKILESTLKTVFAKERISHVVVGHPVTMKGTASDQTRKIVAYKEELEKKFHHIKWVLWDERLTSKQAASLKQAKTKEEKLKQHAVAAALILQSYLDHLSYTKDLEQIPE